MMKADRVMTSIRWRITDGDKVYFAEAKDIDNLEKATTKVYTDKGRPVHDERTVHRIWVAVEECEKKYK